MNLAEWMRAHGIMRTDHKLPSPLEQAKAPTIPPHPDSATDVHGVAFEPAVSPEEITAGNAAIRKVLDESGYGSFVSNEQSTSLATAVLVAAANQRHGNV